EPGEDMETIEATDASPESQIIRREAVQRLLDCLKGLADRDRQIIALRFGSDVRNKDIAAQLGLKEKTVSVILLRAFERLRTCQGER
ncbi:MAG: sigma-70 family RNA polymerase sigma factor, partial [Anaerolineae bacterium]|nr:sigma-70 family RNA polymerase sigma factor [Anaerolineae bacterium]